MSYDYAEYADTLATMMATTTDDQYFQAMLPNAIDYAEQRIYRQLDLLNTRFRDSSKACTAGQRQQALVGTLMVLETLAVITLAGAQPPAGTRNLLVPVTHDFIDAVYPTDSPAAYQNVPKFFAMLTQTSVLVGPPPDQGYVLESFGTQRPTPLSSSNTSTVLTQLLPDLFLAASMIHCAAFQKNFGAQADDPKMAQSWESQFQALMVYAQSEEFRKKYEASTWTSMIPSTTADKQRG